MYGKRVYTTNCICLDAELVFKQKAEVLDRPSFHWPTFRLFDSIAWAGRIESQPSCGIEVSDVGRKLLRTLPGHFQFCKGLKLST